MSKLTQGTQLYFVDPDGDVVTEITEVTNLNPGGSPADQIEIEVNTDPGNTSHIRLHELFLDDSIEPISFAVGWSDGTSHPGVDLDGEFDISGATDRTWYQFDGYIADIQMNIRGVKSSISIQRTGETTWMASTNLFNKLWSCLRRLASHFLRH